MKFSFKFFFRRRTICNRTCRVFSVRGLESCLLDYSSAGRSIWKEMACFNFTPCCNYYSYSDSDVRKLVLDSFSFLYFWSMLCRKVFNRFRLYDWVTAKKGSRFIWVIGLVFRCWYFHNCASLLQIYKQRMAAFTIVRNCLCNNFIGGFIIYSRISKIPV